MANIVPYSFAQELLKGNHNFTQAAGTGGGGQGGQNSGSTKTGTANTGGGGGGGQGGSGASGSGTGWYSGGAGGSGVVVLRMRTTDYSGTTTGSPSGVLTVGLVLIPIVLQR